MLKVKTKLRTSLIPNAGLGLFSAERIPKGTLVWCFDEGWDVRILSFPEDEILREFVITYGYLQKDGVAGHVLCLDNARFFNHADSDNANCIVLDDGSTYANQDIEPDTELTCSYDDSFANDPYVGWHIGDGAIPSSKP
jgi:uncharacterized protein